MEISYYKCGDYLLPNIVMDEQPDGDIGKYGRLRRTYLREHRKGTYNCLLMRSTLKAHLVNIDQQARERVETLMDQILSTNPPPDKATDQMTWVCHMNAVKHQAEEIVYHELIYI